LTCHLWEKTGTRLPNSTYTYQSHYSYFLLLILHLSCTNKHNCNVYPICIQLDVTYLMFYLKQISMFRAFLAHHQAFLYCLISHSLWQTNVWSCGLVSGSWFLFRQCHGRTDHTRLTTGHQTTQPHICLP
jgi:hypothetical protein